MSLLKDDELVPLVNQVVKNMPEPPPLPAAKEGEPAPEPWYGQHSPIQASSMDLHIGKILIPGAQANTTGSVEVPKDDFTLKFGHTIVVTTIEELHLPDDLAAFGFPPARLSSRGLLMTNPGHVDPGYIGPMRFTVINMGKEDINLRKGDAIVTLLFFRLSGAAHAGYAKRRGTAGTPTSGPTQPEVDRLSLDFLDVSGRAQEAATAAVSKSESRAKFWGIVVPGITTVIGALVVGFVGLWQPLNQVRTELDQVKRVLDLKETKSRLDRLDDLDNLQRQINDLKTINQNKVAPVSAQVGK